MNTAQLLSQIDSEISKLQQARNLLTGHETGNGRVATAVRKKRVLSAEAREKIAAAQKRRWAKRKKAAK